jgi:transcription elongation factor SPT6
VNDNFSFLADKGDTLEEDDLDLLEENTGSSFRNRLTRLRRARHSDSPPEASSSRRKSGVESSDDDLDDGLPKVRDIQQIWEDRRGDDDDLDDSDGFITSDDDPEGTGAAGEDEKAERREKRRQEKARLKARGGRPELVGMDAK